MTNLIKQTKKSLSRMERGQVLVVVAVSIVAIIAIMGLALDVGMMFIGNARLRRAVDAAALAAALQYRAGFHMDYLDNTATEFLRLNGINDPNARVLICWDHIPNPGDSDYDDYLIHNDPTLCTDPPRKLVRVVATGTIQLAFLPVIGINQVPIAAEAISETASVAVALLIDRSESMTYTAPPATSTFHDPMRDPSVCNNSADPNFNPNDPNFIDPITHTNTDPYDSTYTGYCRPFDEVKKAAVSFVNDLYFPYDLVAVVTFDQNANQTLIGTPPLTSIWSNNKDEIIKAIKGLTVDQGVGVYPNGLPSRYYDPVTGYYLGLGCPSTDPAHQADYPDIYPSPAPCTTTNIGGGLDAAGVLFNINPPVRQNELWVTVLLTDGVANAGYYVNDSGKTIYYCPPDTWNNTNMPPKCHNGYTKSNPANRHTPNTDPHYDAEDYAYDAAEFVAHDQSALLFTIGLGPQVVTPSSVDGTKLGELFLQYAADHACDPTNLTTICPGTYTFAPNGAALQEVFRKIAENIATRLSH